MQAYSANYSILSVVEIGKSSENFVTLALHNWRIRSISLCVIPNMHHHINDSKSTYLQTEKKVVADDLSESICPQTKKKKNLNIPQR